MYDRFDNPEIAKTSLIPDAAFLYLELHCRRVSGHAKHYIANGRGLHNCTYPYRQCGNGFLISGFGLAQVLAQAVGNLRRMVSVGFLLLWQQGLPVHFHLHSVARSFPLHDPTVDPSQLW